MNESYRQLYNPNMSGPVKNTAGTDHYRFIIIDGSGTGKNIWMIITPEACV
jgi:hypothetical protein